LTSRAVAAAAALVVVGSACGYRVVADGRVNERAASRIERGLAAIRGLAFTEPVEMDVKRPETLRAYLVDILDQDYSPEDIRDLARVYAMLGLLPPGFDLREALLHLYTAQIAGFYDPRTHRLYLVDPPAAEIPPSIEVLQFLIRRDLVGEMLLAHELTHALQDQTSQALAAADDPENDDRALAIRAVVEGDATLAGFAYTLGGLREDALMSLVDRLGAIPNELAAVLPDTPPVLREPLVFQYSQGARFTAWAYFRGGWPAVDALLRHPPVSTEQVLWPERFFQHPDAPTRVGLGGLEDYRDGGEWRLLEENTIGELVMRIQIAGLLGEERAEWSARGWDGDRYAAFARGDEAHLFWLSSWDSERDAREFFDAEREALAKRTAPEDLTATAELASGTGSSPWLVERRGMHVLVAIGVPPAALGERRERIWTASTFTIERPEADLDLGRAER
jgi:hypothetical protein